VGLVIEPDAELPTEKLSQCDLEQPNLGHVSAAIDAGHGRLLGNRVGIFHEDDHGQTVAVRPIGQYVELLNEVIQVLFVFAHTVRLPIGCSPG